jgi:hypothetical protein
MEQNIVNIKNGAKVLKKYIYSKDGHAGRTSSTGMNLEHFSLD